MNAQALPLLFQEDLYSIRAQMVVVLRKDWDRYEEEEQILLTKILASVRVDFNAVRMIALPAVDLSALQIYTPARVLIFGSVVADNVPSYEAISAQGFTAIRADDLTELDDQKKKSLWLALRPMFGV